MTFLRILRYVVLRAASLFVTVVIGVYLAILIANMGGYVDGIRKAQIREQIGATMLADQKLRTMPPTEVRRVIDQQIGLEEKRLGLDRPFLISSGASLLAMPQAAPYGAAKAAVNNLTGSMAAAWTRKGIRVNAIAVGAVRAATLLDDAARYGLGPRAITYGDQWSSGRLGDPDEIGYGVLFFASDASRVSVQARTAVHAWRLH